MGENSAVRVPPADSLVLVPLHHRPDLITSCAELLNQTWRRSLGARIHSLERSCDDFPMCLALVGAQEGSAVGHVRLCRVIGLTDSLFVESVVVSAEIRGKGYGRKLMEATERYAKKRGFRHLYLTTHDKQDFYYHLGYRLTEPVQNMGTLSILLPAGMYQKMAAPKTIFTSNHCVVPTLPHEASLDEVLHSSEPEPIIKSSVPPPCPLPCTPSPVPLSSISTSVLPPPPPLPFTPSPVLLSSISPSVLPLPTPPLSTIAPPPPPLTPLPCTPSPIPVSSIAPSVPSSSTPPLSTVTPPPPPPPPLPCISSSIPLSSISPSVPSPPSFSLSTVTPPPPPPPLPSNTSLSSISTPVPAPPPLPFSLTSLPLLAAPTDGSSAGTLAQLKVGSSLKTPYQDFRGNPVFWMKKSLL
ncbi:N-alpha-acetyltransferase 80 [Hyperolius riggenbachi]|uniref:N-alpha-acetyltransferase 80 n=1 Tax=Hyperolius riggenbachi TaxID=752182 RepID=UPI0035A2B853